MRPIAIETRKIIVAAKERGEKLKAIASWTGVSISSIYRICQLSQKNMLEPKKYRGRQSVLTSKNLEQIKKTVEAVVSRILCKLKTVKSSNVGTQYPIHHE